MGPHGTDSRPPWRALTVCRCPLMIWIWLCYYFRALNKWMALTCPDRFELADIPSRDGRLGRRPRHRSLPAVLQLEGPNRQLLALSRCWRSTRFNELRASSSCHLALEKTEQ
jgi:hypothetical protein